MNTFLSNNWKSLIVVLSIPIWLNVGASCAHAEEPLFKIAIIDTGYDVTLAPKGPKLKLCKSGHFDFNSGKPVVGSSHEHGTYVASIIAQELQAINYCAIIFNVMNKKYKSMDTENVVSAFYKASQLNLAAVNASYVGIIKSVAERESVKDAATKIDRIFVAAGNDSKNLDFECLAFPACFDISNVYPVGACDRDGRSHLETSNYGSRIKLWFNGVYNEKNNGTSFAAPRALSAYILELVEVISK